MREGEEGGGTKEGREEAEEHEKRGRKERSEVTLNAVASEHCLIVWRKKREGRRRGREREREKESG